jgi:GNAT superfamily N-acetyltransferase
MNMTIRIRKADSSDMKAIHQLIVELAEYEKAPEQVETSPEQMQQDGFGPRPYFEALVAEDEAAQVVGAAVFYFGYSTWKGKLCYLDDLIVTETHRRKGIGTALLEHLEAYAREQQARQLRWHVLDWNQPAIDFYHKINGLDMDAEWITCRLTIDD